MKPQPPCIECGARIHRNPHMPGRKPRWCSSCGPARRKLAAEEAYLRFKERKGDALREYNRTRMQAWRFNLKGAEAP